MVSMAQIDDIGVFDKWALCVRQVGTEIWVGSMAGEIAAFDLDLKELRRWQAHAGSINGILEDGTTYGGDGSVKDRDGKILAGPFKKPVSKAQRREGHLYVGTYERALYIDAARHAKIAAWHILSNGTLLTVRQTGTQAGNLGPVELSGQEIAPPAWSLSAGSMPKSCYAYFKDGRFGELEPDGTFTSLPWQDPQGPPCVVHGKTRRFFIGNHRVLAIERNKVVGELNLKTKGLYGSLLLSDQRLLIAAADGNLKVVEIAA